MTLKKLRHEVQLLVLYQDLQPLFEVARDFKPDVIVNACEGFRHRRDLEAQVASVIELLGIPFTGSGSRGLQIAQDKSLVRRLAGSLAIETPQAVEVEMNQPLDSVSLAGLAFPVLVKPRDQESSEGIHEVSVVNQVSACLERVAWIREKFQSGVLVEEFIDGQDIYVGLLEDEGLQVLQPRELVFGKDFSGHGIATYRAKWDEAYRKKNGIHSRKATGLTPETLANLETSARQIFDACKLRGFGRVDFRLDLTGRPYLLELNANPSLNVQDDFVQSAKLSGYSYLEIVKCLLKAALPESKELDASRRSRDISQE